MRHRSRGRARAAAQREGSAWRWLAEDIRAALTRHVKRTSRAHKLYVAAIIAAGAVLRAWPLGDAITAPEAAAYLNFISRPFAAIVSDYSLPTNHVLHSLLAKASLSVFGIHSWSLRLPAFLAGVLVLPLLYLLARSLFNRYIALMATAMVAGLPQLVEVGSVANGYSITWAAMLAAMLFGRHVVRESNPWSAAIMGLLLALGMWSVPAMIYPAATAVLWTLFSFLGKYKRSLGERITVLAITVAVFSAATVLLYLPVVLAHGIDQLFHHVSEGERTWKAFASSYDTRVIDFWVFAADPIPGWLLFLGFGGLFHAAYISGKFRAIAFALLLGCVPLSIALLDMGRPQQWAFTLIFMCVGSSMALFYLLKLVQEKAVSSLGKRSRSAWAAAVLLVLFATGLPFSLKRMDHLADARAGAALLAEVMRPDDRICCDGRWEPALLFEFLSAGMGPAQARRVLTEHGTMPPGATLWIPIGRREPPAMRAVLARCGRGPADFEEPAAYKVWSRLEIFAARKR